MGRTTRVAESGHSICNQTFPAPDYFALPPAPTI